MTAIAEAINLLYEAEETLREERPEFGTEAFEALVLSSTARKRLEASVDDR